MPTTRNFFSFLFIFFCCLSAANSQSNKWLLGEWKGIGIIPGSAYNTVFLRTITIKTETKGRFAGLLVQEVIDNKNIRIEREVSGSLINEEVKINTGRTLLVKQPLHGFWADCSSCKMNSSRITVSSDSLILSHETRLCGNYCDGYATYYRSLSEFDTATQRKLVQTFGSPLLVKIFKPLEPNLHAIGNRTAQNMPAKITSRKNEPASHDLITDTSKRNFLVGVDKTNDAVIVQSQLARKNKTIATYDVTAASIKVELFDNGEIDGDTVTVYHNKQRVVDRQLLGIRPVVFTVKADAQNRVHEFILVANNLGRIPPNTALMRITAGSKTYELFASTNLQENASVIIVYSGD